MQNILNNLVELNEYKLRKSYVNQEINWKKHFMTWFDQPDTFAANVTPPH